MGSAVGSGALTFRVSIIIAAIFELVGSVGFGASVTDSVKSGIIKEEYQDMRPDLIMWSNLSALLTGTVWLVGASVLGLPVSTTHTVVGCLFGAGLAIPEGYKIINWVYLGTVVASWFISPILCMGFTMLIYGLYRKYILRHDADKAIMLAEKTLWGTIFLTCAVFGIFFVLKTPMSQEWAEENVGAAVGVGVGIGVVCMLVITPFFKWFAKRKMKSKDELEELELAKSQVEATGSVGDEYEYYELSDDLEERGRHRKASSSRSKDDLFDDGTDDESAVDCNEMMKKKWYALPWFMDIKAVALANDIHATQAYDTAERFHPRTEQYFAYLQVITSCMSCVVHGANDVANATAAFSSIFEVYDANGIVEGKMTTPYWILALGGASIGIGVFFLGHKVIMSMGFKLAAITPSRGFCMELSTTLVMVVGSFAGIPLSTTHCKVGGTMAIALMEQSDRPPRKRNLMGRLNPSALNCRLVTKIIVSWIATLVVAAAMSATVFSLGIYSPRLHL
eukprot:GHVH01000198.1.p1 GENE.GHVH01000198.1~~GHVH01000198.1.p1  ORF type:complete len:582 (+),score=76.05 GHVH01000198.1:225-1748(+)